MIEINYTLEEKQKVLNTLEDSEYLWRTIDGISKETKVNPYAIRKIFEDIPDQIIESSIRSKAGKRLFTTRRHFRSRASYVQKIWRAFKNRST